MKKKSVNLITAVGVLVVLSAAYAGVKSYTASQEAKESEADEEETTEVFSASADDIQSVKFLIDKKEVTFEKSGDNWVKSDETGFPVSQDTLTSAVGNLESLTADRVLTDVEDISEYGLDQPTNTITVTTADGETVLKVGIENDSTSQYYLEKDDDEKTVYVVASSSITPFTKTLYDYAEASSFPTIDSSTISDVKVEGTDSSYEMSKDENSSLWYVEDSDGSEKADSAKAETLTSSVSALAYDTFVNYNCTDLSEYGLDKPYATITVDYTAEETVSASDSESSDDEESGETTEDVSDDSESSADMEDSGEAVTSTDAEDSSEDVSDAEQVDDTASDVAESDDTTEASSESSETTTSSDSSDTTTVTVDKQLVILVGNEAENDSRYVKVGDSNEIYTISTETLSAVTDKTKADLWDLTVNYLSVNNLSRVDVDYDGESHSVIVSRETSSSSSDSSSSSSSTSDSSTSTTDSSAASNSSSTDSSSSDSTSSSSSSSSSSSDTTTTLVYKFDGQKIDGTEFLTYYNKLINMAAQKRLTEENFTSDGTPDMKVKFTDVDGNETEVSYYPYDENFYAVVVGEKKVYMVNKMTVKEMLESYQTFLDEK